MRECAKDYSTITIIYRRIRDIINAGKETVTLFPGASVFGESIAVNIS